MKTSILIKVVDSETNEHHAAFRLDYASMCVASLVLKQTLPLMLTHAKLTVEQLNFNFTLDGVKLK